MKPRRTKLTSHNLTLLLIIAGDVHVNPGPKFQIQKSPQKHHCSMCKEEIYQETILQCDTCKHWCHLRCTGNDEVGNKILTQFEWICSHKNCKPNHSEAIYYQRVILSPNRYNILSITARPNTSEVIPTDTHNYLLDELTTITSKDYIGKDICLSCHKEVKETHRTAHCELCQRCIHIKCSDMTTKQYKDNQRKRIFNWKCNICRTDKMVTANPKPNTLKRSGSKNIKPTNIWTELPKISSKDFIGKELCKACHKAIKESQRAISCDSCKRWIHQKCSDMGEKTFNANVKKTDFPWVCNVCRLDENNSFDKPDITLLKPEEMPETLQNIKTKNTLKELLIIHLNCRSVVNKTEELEDICKTIEPDIICLTETWLDESVPSPLCTPSGYKIIRKDRSEVYKQKYGRNKGGGIAVCYKEHLKVERRDYLTEDCEEILWVQVKTK